MSQHDQQKQIQSLDPFALSPEKASQQEKLEKQFDGQYAHVLKDILEGDEYMHSLIRGKYLQNGGNIQKALQNSVKQLSLTPKEQQELYKQLAESLSLPEDSQQEAQGQPKSSLAKTPDTQEKESPSPIPQPQKTANRALIPEEQTLDSKDALAGDTQETDGQQKMFESPEYVILSRYLQDGKLDRLTTQTIQDEVVSGKSFAESIESQVQDPTVKKALLENIDENPKDEEAQKQKRQGDFFKDFQDLAGGEGVMKKQMEVDSVFEAIASNYIKIPQKDGTYDKDRDFSTAVQVAHRKILAESPNLNKDTETYRRALADLESGDHSREYRGLQYMYREGNAGDAKGKKLDDQNHDALKASDYQGEMAKILGAKRISELLKAHHQNSKKSLDDAKQAQEQARLLEAQSRKDLPEVVFEIPSAQPQEKIKE